MFKKILLLSVTMLTASTPFIAFAMNEDEQNNRKGNNINYDDQKKDKNENDLSFTVEEDGIKKIVLLGGSRSGKTTLLQMLQNPNKVNSRFNYTDTTECTIHRFEIQNSILFALDTPSFFQYEDISSKRNDELLQHTEREITKFYGNRETVEVLFTFTVDAGIPQKDLSAINKYLNLLKNLFEQHKIAGFRCTFVATHFEFEDDEDREEFRSELLKHYFFGNIRPTQNDSSRITPADIFFSGCLIEESLGIGFDQALFCFKQITSIREELLFRLGFEGKSTEAMELMLKALNEKDHGLVNCLSNQAAQNNQRIAWEKDNHQEFPNSFRAGILTFLLAERSCRNQQRTCIPPFVRQHIIYLAAIGFFDVPRRERPIIND